MADETIQTPGWYPDPTGLPGLRWWDSSAMLPTRWIGRLGAFADRRLGCQFGCHWPRATGSSASLGP